MSLCVTHVPAPAGLGARRCGFSLGRRVASSGPVACSSSSSSSFFSRPKNGSNGRTLALRTRAAADGKNGGRGIARHPTHQHLRHTHPPLCIELNGILRSSCPALRSGVSARPVDSSDWKRSVNQGFFGDQRGPGDTVPVPDAAVAAVAAPPVESSDWTRSVNQGFFGDTRSPDDAGPVAANSAVSVPGLFSDPRTAPVVSDPVTAVSGPGFFSDLRVPDVTVHVAAGSAVSAPGSFSDLRQGLLHISRHGARRKPGASSYTLTRLSM